MHVQFLNFQLNTHDVYLQETYEDCMEFLGDDGKFDIKNYVQEHKFTVNGLPIPTSNVGEWQTPNAQSTHAPHLHEFHEEHL